MAQVGRRVVADERVRWLLVSLGLIAANLGVRSRWVASWVDAVAISWASGTLVSLTAAAVVLAGLRPAVVENRDRLREAGSDQDAVGGP